MAKPRNKYIDYLMYLVVRLLTMGFHMFSLERNYATARWMGDILYRFDRRHRERAMGHLRLSFPDWPEKRLRKTARASLRNLVYLGVEVLFTTRLITPGRWRRHIELVDQGENIRLLLEHRTPLIYITGHFGNWEVVGYTMAALGFPNVAIARALDNPYLDRYVRGIRENRGLRILDKKGASEHMDELLAANAAVSFIADQDAGRKGLFVDFFGRKASTYKAPAIMAIRHNAPVVVGYGKRLGEGFRFAIGVQRIIYPREWADKPDAVAWITQEYTRAMEDSIRTAPDQYLWMHRRWKHRPKGQPEAGPDGVA
jgi:KDO2-lipid IV(A) lauroyltransferase